MQPVCPPKGHTALTNLTVFYNTVQVTFIKIESWKSNYKPPFHPRWRKELNMPLLSSPSKMATLLLPALATSAGLPTLLTHATSAFLPPLPTPITLVVFLQYQFLPHLLVSSWYYYLYWITIITNYWHFHCTPINSISCLLSWPIALLLNSKAWFTL